MRLATSVDGRNEVARLSIRPTGHSGQDLLTSNSSHFAPKSSRGPELSAHWIRPEAGGRPSAWRICPSADHVEMCVTKGCARRNPGTCGSTRSVGNRAVLRLDSPSYLSSTRGRIPLSNKTSLRKQVHQANVLILFKLTWVLALLKSFPNWRG
jgi:hypothetical protein